MKRRILSILMVVFLIAGICDISAFAEDSTKEQPSEAKQAEGTILIPEEMEEETIPEEEGEVVEETTEEAVIEEDTEEAIVANESADKSSVKEKAVQEKSTEEKDVSAKNATLTYKDFNTSTTYAIMNYGLQKDYKRALLLKVPGNKNGRINPMIISPADHSTGEIFTFRKIYAWYTLAPLCAPSYRMNVEGDNATSDADVGLLGNTNHATQGWYFEPVAGVKDGYIIRSASNPDCVLDVRGTVSGAKVKIKKYESGNLCQIWIVKSYAASISLNKKTATTHIGGTVTVSASKRPVDAAVSYSSSSTKVATVNSKGVITGKGAGTATIYAKCYGKTATCKVTVRKSSLTVDSKLKKTTITKGSTDGVSGTVRSNKKITKVYAQIIGKKNRKTYFSKTVKPNKTSYKLTGTVDNAMKFNKLGTGTYEFKVTAWDTSGNKISKSINCTVKSKGKTHKFMWPAVSTKINQQYKGRSHTGLDIRASKNSKLYAAEGGKVQFAGQKGKNSGGMDTYGKYVLIKHSSGYLTLYAHCNSLKVKTGQKVKKGQVIALAGSTGNSTGPHLHFEVHKSSWGKRVDPGKFDYTTKDGKKKNKWR